MQEKLENNISTYVHSTVFDIQMWQRQIFRKQISISAAHTFSE